MFWDAAALNEGRLLAVGSTNYTQNPSGPSVSDTRDPLALVLDASGNVEKRIVLLAGPADRRNEARRRPSAMAVEWQSPACRMRQALMRQCSRTHFLSCDGWSSSREPIRFRWEGDRQPGGLRDLRTACAGDHQSRVSASGS